MIDAPDLPEPIWTALCSLCGEKWDDHERFREKIYGDDDVEDEFGHSTAPIGLQPVWAATCVEVLKWARLGPVGPVGPMGMHGKDGANYYGGISA